MPPPPPPTLPVFCKPVAVIKVPYKAVPARRVAIVPTSPVPTGPAPNRSTVSKVPLFGATKSAVLDVALKKVPALVVPSGSVKRVSVLSRALCEPQPEPLPVPVFTASPRRQQGILFQPASLQNKSSGLMVASGQLSIHADARSALEQVNALTLSTVSSAKQELRAPDSKIWRKTPMSRMESTAHSTADATSSADSKVIGLDSDPGQSLLASGYHLVAEMKFACVPGHDRVHNRSFAAHFRDAEDDTEVKFSVRLMTRKTFSNLPWKGMRRYPHALTTVPHSHDLHSVLSIEENKKKSEVLLDLVDGEMVHRIPDDRSVVIRFYSKSEHTKITLEHVEVHDPQIKIVSTSLSDSLSSAASSSLPTKSKAKAKAKPTASASKVKAKVAAVPVQRATADTPASTDSAGASSDLPAYRYPASFPVFKTDDGVRYAPLVYLEQDKLSPFYVSPEQRFTIPEYKAQRSPLSLSVPPSEMDRVDTPASAYDQISPARLADLTATESDDMETATVPTVGYSTAHVPMRSASEYHSMVVGSMDPADYMDVPSPTDTPDLPELRTDDSYESIGFLPPPSGAVHMTEDENPFYSVL